MCPKPISIITIIYNMQVSDNQTHIYSNLKNNYKKSSNGKTKKEEKKKKGNGDWPGLYRTS